MRGLSEDPIRRTETTGALDKYQRVRSNEAVNSFVSVIRHDADSHVIPADSQNSSLNDARTESNPDAIPGARLALCGHVLSYPSLTTAGFPLIRTSMYPKLYPSR